jgi:hypothetical protein
MRVEQLFQYLDLVIRSIVRKPQEYNTVVGMSTSENFFSKVFVIRDQYPVFIAGSSNDRIIVTAPRFFINRKNIMPLLSQPSG